MRRKQDSASKYREQREDGTAGARPASALWTPARVIEALEGDEGQQGELVAELTPVIRGRVRRRLIESGASLRCGAARFGVDDLTQDALVRLFERDARVLRRWDPALGLSLRNFVGLVAERLVSGRLRNRSAWSEIATEDVRIHDRPVTGREPRDPISTTEQRQMLEVLSKRLAGRISGQGMAAFRLLFIEEREVRTVARRMGTTVNAVYAWRSRIKKQLRLISAQLDVFSESHWPRSDLSAPEAA